MHRQTGPQRDSCFPYSLGHAVEPREVPAGVPTRPPSCAGSPARAAGRMPGDKDNRTFPACLKPKAGSCHEHRLAQRLWQIAQLDQLIEFHPYHEILPKLQTGALLLNEALGFLVKFLQCFWRK
jgi:hypothetical protein